MHLFRSALPTDADRCFEIEISAYEGDEAASHAKIAKRIDVHPDGFLVLEMAGQVAGFINSGCVYQVEMSDEAFKDLVGHDPQAPNVVIMSVVVDPSQQGKGLSKALMIEFVERMRRMGKSSIHLMCKEHHVPLYQKYGYSYLQPSSSDHGGKTWHEMSLAF